MSSGDFDVLLLDFGGVCLVNPVELHAKAEQHFGLPPGTFSWLGPVDPSTDELWQQMIAGRLTERDYWGRRAAEVGATAGRDLSVSEYMSLLYDPPSDNLIRPGARQTVERALEAGLGVSILTNDMRAFHGREWEKGIEFLSLVDHIVDCSDTDVLKPDPRAFARAEEIIGAAGKRVLFVDDQPRSVAGAEKVGLTAMWFDIAHATESWATVARRVGVRPL